MSSDVSRTRGYVLTLFLAYCASTFSISLFCFHSRSCGCPRPLAPKNKHVLFGTKMIALFWGANGVLQAYAKQVELLQSLWCDTKEVYLAVCQV